MAVPGLLPLLLALTGATGSAGAGHNAPMPRRSKEGEDMKSGKKTELRTEGNH